MEFLFDSLVLHRSHWTTSTAVPGVNLASCNNRASVLSPDEAHLLGAVIRAIQTAPDSLEPPDHKPTDGGEWPGGLPSWFGLLLPAWRLGGKGDGVTVDNLYLKCGNLSFTGTNYRV